jgi:tRNA/rRNA methyltransferase
MDEVAEGGDEARGPDAPSLRGRRADPLSKVHVVLVEPQGPRNVGAVARALKNFGLSRLRLAGGVPKDSPEALENAVWSADILQSALQVPGCDEALADLTFVVATTARRRHRLPTYSPREIAPRILEEASRGQVGILFGREDHGLSGDEIGRAHAVVSIRTSPGCRALNLSHAVALVANEIFLASGERGRDANAQPGRLVDAAVRQRLQADMEAALRALAILKPGNEIQIVRSLERLLTLGPMQMRDARLLFTLAKKIVADAAGPAGDER